MAPEKEALVYEYSANICCVLKDTNNILPALTGMVTPLGIFLGGTTFMEFCTVVLWAWRTCKLWSWLVWFTWYSGPRLTVGRIFLPCYFCQKTLPLLWEYAWFFAPIPIRVLLCGRQRGWNGWTRAVLELTWTLVWSQMSHWYFILLMNQSKN